MLAGRSATLERLMITWNPYGMILSFRVYTGTLPRIEDKRWLACQGLNFTQTLHVAAVGR